MTKIQSFRYADSPWQWVTHEELAVASLQQVLDTFNRLMHRFDPSPSEPLGPSVWVTPEVMWVPFSRCYAVAVDRSQNAFGPHNCRLMYRSEQLPEAADPALSRDWVWVANLQVSKYIHSPDFITELITKLHTGCLWQSLKTSQIVVLL